MAAYAKADPAKLVKRYERLKHRRSTVDVRQQELAQHIIPHKAVITIERFEGEDMTEELLDSTAVHANELLASSIQSSLMSDRWFALGLRGSSDSAKDVVDWLEQVTERMLQAQKQSNFNAEHGELCLDIGAFGIGCLFIEERTRQAQGFGGMRYQCIPPGSYAIAEDKEGRVDTLFREYKMSAVQMKEDFGEDALPEPVKNALPDRPDQEFDIVHAVYPRKDVTPGKRGAKYMPFASCYVEKRTKTLLRESGFEEFPYAVPRWSKTSGEVYGRGPGHTAMPFIRVLKRVVQLTLSAASKAIDPPGLTNSDAVFGELELRPASQNPVDGDPAKAWMPMESGAKFDVSNLTIERYQKAIEHIFFWEQLQLQGERVMTATEVERRLELMRRVLGPTLGRFESELLNPELQRQFGIMFRAGALPEPPEALLGVDIDIEYKGPLARSQKTSRLQASDEVFAKILQLAQISPDAAIRALDNIDLDNWIRDQASIAGLPSENMTTPEYRKQVRDARAQQQAQAAKIQGALQVSEAASKLLPGLPALKEAMGGQGPMGQKAA